MRLKYTPQQIDFVKLNYLLPITELTEQFNNEFGAELVRDQVHSLRKRLGLRTGRTGHFPKGNVPWSLGTTGAKTGSKTSFAKGHRPHNWCPVGTERLTSIDKYIKVKVEEPNKWRFKHLLVWEQNNGPIPKGMLVVFKDDDRSNVQIDNLEMITRSELVRLNKNRASQMPESLKPTIKALIKLDVKRFEREKTNPQSL